MFVFLVGCAQGSKAVLRFVIHFLLKSFSCGQSDMFQCYIFSYMMYISLRLQISRYVSVVLLPYNLKATKSTVNRSATGFRGRLNSSFHHMLWTTLVGEHCSPNSFRKFCKTFVVNFVLIIYWKRQRFINGHYDGHNKKKLSWIIWRVFISTLFVEYFNKNGTL